MSSCILETPTGKWKSYLPSLVVSNSSAKSSLSASFICCQVGSGRQSISSCIPEPLLNELEPHLPSLVVSNSPAKSSLSVCFICCQLAIVRHIGTYSVPKRSRASPRAVLRCSFACRNSLHQSSMSSAPAPEASPAGASALSFVIMNKRCLFSVHYWKTDHTARFLKNFFQVPSGFEDLAFESAIPPLLLKKYEMVGWHKFIVSFMFRRLP